LLTSPHETSTLVISHWMHVEEFFFEDIQVLVIQIEAHLEGAIRHPALTLEQCEYLGENLIEGHR
jgi:hypothetical protein